MKNQILPVYDIEEFKYLGTETNFYANTLSAHLREHAPSILVPHKHSFYFSVICTKGSGTHEIEFINYDVHPGTVFMIGPGQVHNWQLSKDIDGFVFFHTKEFYNLYFTSEKVENYPFYCNHHNSPLIVLKNLSFKKSKEIYAEIVSEYQQHELMNFHKISSLINILYINLSRIYIPQKENQNQNFTYLTKVKKLEDLINENFKVIKSPKVYAHMMHISEKHLNRISKTTLNKTLSELITDRVILETKRMLVHSSNNISEIISELGYDDHSYFSRFFKKNTGKTPLEFSNQFRK